jgi:hypothetical protein
LTLQPVHFLAEFCNLGDVITDFIG